MEDRAAAPVVGFVTAAVVYLVLFLGILAFVDQQDDTSGLARITLEGHAQAAAAILAGTTGETVGWEAAPDSVTRLGLLEEDAARIPADLASFGLLDLGKIALLRQGEVDASANGAVDVPEARAALALPDEVSFHLRTRPILSSVDAPDAADDSLEVAYLGHVLPTSAPAPASITSIAARAGPGSPPAYVDLLVTVANGGADATPYRLTFSLAPEPGARGVSDENATQVVAPGASATVFHRLRGVGPASAWKLGDTVRVDLSDVHSNALDTESASFPKPADPARAFAVRVEPASAYFLAGAAEYPVYVDHHDGSGRRLTPAPVVDVRFLLGGLVEVARFDDVALSRTAAVTLDCGASCAAVGSYVVQVDGGAGWEDADQFAVLAAVVPQPDDESYPSRWEAGLLGGLATRFTNSTARAAGCDAQLLAGDKYEDTKDGAEALVAALLRPDGSLCYDTVVIGSEVRHSALTSAEVKHGLAAWVDAGGTLIVFASGEQRIEWLQSFGGAGLRPASGGMGTPDPDHPLLSVPNVLNPTAYRDTGVAWDLAAAHADDYTHVLLRGGLDLLAVSRAGAFGDGTIVLCAYAPYDLLPGGGAAEQAEARRLAHNLLVHSYASLFLDYGPAVPPGAQVASASELVAAPHPGAPGDVVDVEVLVYAFQ